MQRDYFFSPLLPRSLNSRVGTSRLKWAKSPVKKIFYVLLLELLNQAHYKCSSAIMWIQNSLYLMRINVKVIPEPYGSTFDPDHTGKWDQHKKNIYKCK